MRSIVYRSWTILDRPPCSYFHLLQCASCLTASFIAHGRISPLGVDSTICTLLPGSTASLVYRSSASISPLSRELKRYFALGKVVSDIGDKSMIEDSLLTFVKDPNALYQAKKDERRRKRKAKAFRETRRLNRRERHQSYPCCHPLRNRVHGDEDERSLGSVMFEDIVRPTVEDRRDNRCAVDGIVSKPLRRLRDVPYQQDQNADHVPGIRY